VGLSPTSAPTRSGRHWIACTGDSSYLYGAARRGPTAIDGRHPRSGREI
jgi:hypothetical protein